MTEYQENAKRWQAVKAKVRGWDVRAFDIVRIDYDEELNQSHVTCSHERRSAYVVKSKKVHSWSESGDARQRMRGNGFYSGHVYEAAGDYIEWGRECFDYLVNYEKENEE